MGGGFFTEQDGERGAARARLPWRERWGLALEERLPAWLRLRCGIEPKTLVALVLVLLVAVGFAVHHFWTGRPQGVAVPSAEGAPEGGPTARPPGGASPVPGSGGVAAASTSASPGKRLVVDVSGKVRDPGVHRLPAGSRVTDALEAAGGLRKGADTSGLNRARLLVDGEQIVVGKPGKGGAAAPPGATAGGGASTGAASGGPAAPVSLSAATPEQLENLPGVGPVLAQHIVDYRTEHGGFTTVDQLKEVNGIGEKRFADIEPKVTP
ncbi:ComEA family DNA-binding protein [Streptomyces reniochalinae]|uniref:ComEA family DNA-binding protein n=1 Tax=Streptomyces reniochalinae TaxID=2250578 RepID=UPI00319DCA32